MPRYQQQDLTGQGNLFFDFCPGINETALDGKNESYFIARKKILSLCWELGRTNTHGECMP